MNKKADRAEKVLFVGGLAAVFCSVAGIGFGIARVLDKSKQHPSMIRREKERDAVENSTTSENVAVKTDDSIAIADGSNKEEEKKAGKDELKSSNNSTGRNAAYVMKNPARKKRVVSNVDRVSVDNTAFFANGATTSRTIVLEEQSD